MTALHWFFQANYKWFIACLVFAWFGTAFRMAVDYMIIGLYVTGSQLLGPNYHEGIT